MCLCVSYLIQQQKDIKYTVCTAWTVVTFHTITHGESLESPTKGDNSITDHQLLLQVEIESIMFTRLYSGI